MKGKFMKQDKKIEEILLNDVSYEKFVNSKLEKDFEKEISSGQKLKNEFITNIKNVPAEKLFSKNAVYIVMNKNSKTKSYINGIQAEAFLASDNISREKLMSHQTDSFVHNECYIKFYKLKV